MRRQPGQLMQVRYLSQTLSYHLFQPSGQQIYFRFPSFRLLSLFDLEPIFSVFVRRLCTATLLIRLDRLFRTHILFLGLY